MRRSIQITTVVLTAALSLPALADADQAPIVTGNARQAPTVLADAVQPPTVIADSDAASLLADAAPVTSAPVPPHPLSLEHVPLAARDRTLLADAGSPQQLLAQAPATTTTPPTTALPRTGPEVYLTLLAGGGLLLAGAGLRLRTPSKLRLATADGAA